MIAPDARIAPALVALLVDLGYIAWDGSDGPSGARRLRWTHKGWARAHML